MTINYPANSSYDEVVKDNQQISVDLNNTRKYLEREYLDLLTDSTCCDVLSVVHKKWNTVRLFRLVKIVYDEEEYYLKMQSLYHSIVGLTNTFFMLICGSNDGVEFYVGVQSDYGVDIVSSTLEASVHGNFPGSKVEKVDEKRIPEIMRKVSFFNGARTNTVVGVSQVPSQRIYAGENNKEMINIQGLEHFIDGMKGMNYTAFIIATPLSSPEIINLKVNLQNLYSSLSVFEEFQYQYGKNEALSTQRSLTDTVSKAITDSVLNGVTYGTMDTSGTSKGKAPSVNTRFSSFGLGYGKQHGSFVSSGTQNTTSQQNGSANTSGSQTSKTNTDGKTEGTNKGVVFTQKNRSVEDLLNTINEQLERLRTCEAYGLWNCCAFFSAEKQENSIVAANMYKSLVCGDESSMERSCVSIWNADKFGGYSLILDSLMGLNIPLFQLKTQSKQKCRYGTLVSGKELPILMGFPRKSVRGVTAVQMAPFGREVQYIDEPPLGNQLIVGKPFHMGQEENGSVGLSLSSLAKHTFITGASGVGKTTFNVSLAVTLASNNIKILIIEPEKGEYKDLMGRFPQIRVFTTNPLKHRLLRVNPFVFRSSVNILSHIDRILDVFNVCWPLYGAQPALLRDCIEEAYLKCGWDLANSRYVGTGVPIFPDFNMILDIVPEVIDKSRYVGEAKGTYEGAILTRVKMLTRGIFRQIFSRDCYLSDEELFEDNGIVDLSEVGSPETNALIMGILVIKLREYRMEKGIQEDGLKHVIFLEEAHNIFPSSSKKNVEGGENLSGKSIEMMSKCLAELRAYGQGFVVIDQSPNAVDPACIRNTSTKVVFRLSERTDHEVVSAAMSLNEKQTGELFRLPNQVAVVYQEGWIEPIMVKMNTSHFKYRINHNEQLLPYDHLKMIRGFFIGILRLQEKKNQYSAASLSSALNSINGLSTEKKKDFQSIINAFESQYNSISSNFPDIRQRKSFYRRLVLELMGGDDILRLIHLPEVKLSKELESDSAFFEQCRGCQSQALLLLDHYIGKCSEGYNYYMEDKDWLLELLLLDEKNPISIYVHNNLYGKIRR